MTAQPEDGGRVFREGWIAGVRKHYPGDPKPGYVAEWPDTPDWERASAAAVYTQVRALLDLTEGHAARLTRTQKSQFIAACWTAQIFRHFAEPKASYVAEWEQLPDWQRETDADIFDRITQDYLASK